MTQRSRSGSRPRKPLLCFALATVFGFARLTHATAGFSGQNMDLTIPAGDGRAELVLSIDYSIRCTGLQPGITGSVQLDERTLRFDLLEGKSGSKISLGVRDRIARTAHLGLDPSSGCELTRFNPRVDSVVLSAHPSTEELALAHCPFLVVRDDQFENRWTDLPLLMAYSTWNDPDGDTVIRYTLIMSDEDSEKTSAETDAQMARYGRRTDIEWPYQVTVTSSDQPKEQLYQGDIFVGFGHSTRKFGGEFLEGGGHPILYNIADHNVFSDSPDGHQIGKMIGYSLAPADRIDYPDAREIEMFRNPWMFLISDFEMAREGKLSLPSENWLYVLVDGKLDSGSFIGRVTLQDGEVFESGGGNGDVDRLGEDLWGAEALTAIPLGTALLSRMSSRGTTVHGNFRIASDSTGGAELKTRSLRFFELTRAAPSFRVDEVTSLFHCSKWGEEYDIQLSCEF